MKRIVICLDGTWNKVAKPDEVTNVVKFAQSVKPIAEGGIQQVVYYNSGVGTGGPIDRFLGGVFGAGIKGNVQRAYAFLTLNYSKEDEIYIVGFSRGAYTARALASIINAVGVLKREEFERFEAAWNYYRVPPEIRRRYRRFHEHPSPEPSSTVKETSAHKKAIENIEAGWFCPASVKALGVWDTVGSYGIPAGFALSGLAKNFSVRELGFHDRQLGKQIENAFHAVAIDEARGAFTPTFWTGPKDEPVPNNVEQVWFPGVHSDVGGGYKETGLSDLALVWMLDRISSVGLGINAQFVRDNVDPCPACLLHRSDGRVWQFLRPYRRRLFEERLPLRDRSGRDEMVLNERLHWCAARRWEAGGMYEGQYGPYRPANVRAGLPDLPASKPGPFETEILLGHRDHDTTWSPHDRCWTVPTPDQWSWLRSPPGAVSVQADKPEEIVHPEKAA